MKLNQLAGRPGASKARMRVGRGIGSGKGKTGGRGGKGQTARSGVRIKGFEGGQMPLHRRLPKRGFRNTAFQLDLNEINLGRVQSAIDAGALDAGKPVDVETLVNAGILSRARGGVKLLGGGEIKAKVEFTVWRASKSAVAAVEKAGGIGEGSRPRQGRGEGAARQECALCRRPRQAENPRIRSAADQGRRQEKGRCQGGSQIGAED